MSIRRGRHESNYTIISNSMSNDRRLSFEARGVLLYLLTKPEDWIVRMADVCAEGSMGKDRYHRIVRELEEAGYLVREQKRDEEGRMAGVDFVVFDTPPPEETADQPEPENPATVNPPHTKELNFTKKGLLQKADEIEELQLEGEKPIEPEQQVLEKYESLRGTCGWPAVKSFTTQRRKSVHARIAEHGLAEVLDALDRAARSDFLAGRQKGAGHENWRCDFDFLMSPQKFAFLIEGKYDNRGASCETGSPASADDIWDIRVDSFLTAVEARKRPTWLESWGPRPWSDGSLVPPETLAKHQSRVDAIRAKARRDGE